MSESLGVSLACSFLTIFVLGMYYTIIGTSFAFSETATLISAGVKNSNGNDGYKEVETFRYVHNMQNNTCVVTRPHYYAFYGSANNAAIEEILYTTRKVWISSYDSNTCQDAVSKEYYMTIGATLLSCVGFILLIIIFAISYDGLKRFIVRRRNAYDNGNINLFSNV